MGLSCAVGGAKSLFAEAEAAQVAGAIDQAFGAESEWEGTAPRRFGELTGPDWAVLRDRAVAELGADALPNLLALSDTGRTVYLPAHVQAVTLPIRGADPIRCASLHGLRAELEAIAELWRLPLDDGGLSALLRVHADPDDGFVTDPPEVLAFARLALAANEAVRRDCPLWLMG